MYKFLIKKTFFDMWDNFYVILMLNVGFIAIVALVFQIPNTSITLVSFLLIFFKIEVIFVYCGFVNRLMFKIANYEELDKQIYKESLLKSYKNSLIFGGLVGYLVISFILGLGMYQNTQSQFGLIFLAIFFWTTIGIFLLLQWYFPVDARFDVKFFDQLKKCLILFFDNGAFSLGMFLGLVVVIGISSFTALMVPGITVVLLWLNVATKLRLYKYDYLEEHPNTSRKDIPWKELLKEDQDIVGKRTLKGLIFPWKE